MDTKLHFGMIILLLCSLSLAVQQHQQQYQHQEQQHQKHRQQQQKQHDPEPQHQCLHSDQQQQQHCHNLKNPPEYEENRQHTTSIFQKSSTSVTPTDGDPDDTNSFPEETQKNEFENKEFHQSNANEYAKTKEAKSYNGVKKDKNTQKFEPIIPKTNPASSEKTKDGQAVTVKHLHSHGDFEKFIRDGLVHLVYFYHKGGITPAVRTFLKEFKLSASQLSHYKIYLAMVDCELYLVSGYCAPDKVSRFAYGFRDGAEKIAFPLDTLFNANAIVASALHLSLINSVPILQSASERRSLEQRCKGRADILFAFHRTLGTYEHRIFLELAYAYQERYVFALTTYTAGTLGLRELQQTKQEDQEEVNQLVWVIQCASHSVSQDCVDSPYRRKMLLPDLLNFMTIISKPKWSEMSLPKGSADVVTPYDGLGLPWMFLIHDGASRSGITDLAPNLAELVRGAVAVFTVDLEVLSDKVLSSIGLHRDKVHAPALAFLPPGQRSASFLNDYDDALEWVMEQVDILEKEEMQNTDEDIYPPGEPLAELQQDDEVVLGMQKEEIFTELQPIVGEEDYRKTITSGQMFIIAYYLSWDPVSNVLLQHLQDISPILSEARSLASVRMVNCFDWPRVCDSEGVLTYPVLKMFAENKRNITYDGPIHGDYILKTVFLYEEEFPIEAKTDSDFEEILSLKMDTNAARSSDSVAIGIYLNNEDSNTFKNAIGPLFGQYLTSYFISEKFVQKICTSNSGCIMISKPKDIFQPQCVLNENLDNSEVIMNFIKEHSIHVFDVLDPERFTGYGPQRDSSKHVILFLPANISIDLSYKRDFVANTSFQEEKRNSFEQQNYNSKEAKNKGAAFLQSDKDIYTIWKLIGTLAAENTNPGIIFSWIKNNDPVSMEVLPVYGMDANVPSVVLIDRGTANVYTTYTPKLNVRKWLGDVLKGNIQPKLKLPSEAWEPRLSGFDYLKFMMEDQEREAEDHLIREMEKEILPKTGENPNMVKEEL